mgnify:CR=1 FL=1
MVGMLDVQRLIAARDWAGAFVLGQYGRDAERARGINSGVRNHGVYIMLNGSPEHYQGINLPEVTPNDISVYWEFVPLNGCERPPVRLRPESRREPVFISTLEYQELERRALEDPEAGEKLDQLWRDKSKIPVFY